MKIYLLLLDNRNEEFLQVYIQTIYQQEHFLCCISVFSSSGQRYSSDIKSFSSKNTIFFDVEIIRIHEPVILRHSDFIEPNEPDICFF